jgi:hypothetical protein
LINALRYEEVINRVDRVTHHDLTQQLIVCSDLSTPVGWTV